MRKEVVATSMGNVLFNEFTRNFLTKISNLNKGIVFIKEDDNDLRGFLYPFYISCIFNRVEIGNFDYKHLDTSIPDLDKDLTVLAKKVKAYSKTTQDNIRHFVKYLPLLFDCVIYVESSDSSNKYKPKFSDNKFIIVVNQDKNSIKAYLGGYAIGNHLIDSYFGG